MNTQRITKLQKTYNFYEAQKSINSGLVWKMEGSAGRYAMDLLRSGICLLPTFRRIDYYGNVVPSRYDVKPGSPGSYLNAQGFWASVEDGDYEALEAVGAFDAYDEECETLEDIGAFGDQDE
jgi:hypothetical protein